MDGCVTLAKHKRALAPLMSSRLELLREGKEKRKGERGGGGKEREREGEGEGGRENKKQSTL